MFLAIIQVISDAINEIVHRYQKMMYAIAYSFIRDHQLSEDIVQMSLVRINKNLHKIDNVESKRTKNFIITITRHVALSELEKNKSYENHVQFAQEDEFNNMQGEADVSSFVNAYGFSEEMVNALLQLNEIDKNIIIFKYGAGYSYKEIAKIFEMTVDSVYKRSQRALTEMAEIITAESERIHEK